MVDWASFGHFLLAVGTWVVLVGVLVFVGRVVIDGKTGTCEADLPDEPDPLEPPDAPEPLDVPEEPDGPRGPGTPTPGGPAGP